jgi:hypothetical protein
MPDNAALARRWFLHVRERSTCLGSRRTKVPGDQPPPGFGLLRFYIIYLIGH